MKRKRIDAPWTVSAACAVVFLNQLVSSGDFVETPLQLMPSAIAIELLAAMALLGIVALLGARKASTLLWLLTIAFVLAFAVRALGLAVPWFFGRDLNLAIDARFAPVFAKMLSDSMPVAELGLLALGLAVAALIALTIVRAAFGIVFRAFASGAPARLLPGFAILAAFWFALPAAPSSPSPRPFLSADAAAVVARNVDNVLAAEGLRGAHRARIDAAQVALPAEADLAALRGKHVVLIFVESYGRSDVAAPARATLAERLEASGYASASASLISPTTGGGSWMAHGTLLAGVRIAAQDAYEVLLVSGARTLAHRFAAAGWRSVAVMPRIDQPWPEGRLLGFETIRIQPDLGYRGPRFAWETLPDQWVLNRFAELDLGGALSFAKIVLASSHTPFERVPAIVEDWDALGDGRVYEGLPVKEFPVRGGRVFEQDEAHAATIDYVLDAIGRFAGHVANKDILFVVLGDHSPPLTTARRTGDFAVPIHVFARDEAVVEPFLRRGYVPGIAVPASAAPMEDFLAGFLADFSTPK
ncbi:MAG: hypothetical protein NBV67_10155 [Tagaea sp.]|nr:hypothetical protein [Tagaea sp.]